MCCGCFWVLGFGGGASFSSCSVVFGVLVWVGDPPPPPLDEMGETPGGYADLCGMRMVIPVAKVGALHIGGLLGPPSLM